MDLYPGPSQYEYHEAWSLNYSWSSLGFTEFWRSNVIKIPVPHRLRLAIRAEGHATADAGRSGRIGAFNGVFEGIALSMCVCTIERRPQRRRLEQ